MGNGESIKVYLDKWIPNYLANRILHQGHDVDREKMVSELIDDELHWWMHDVIMERFCREEVDAICKIPLSRRNIYDSVGWLHTKNGKYAVKSGYHVARKVLRKVDGVGSSGGAGGKQVWKKICQLHVVVKF